MENVGAIKWLLAEDKSRKARSRNTLKYFMSGKVKSKIHAGVMRKEELGVNRNYMANQVSVHNGKQDKVN